MKRLNILILGAAGRDFHNFNTFFRGKEAYNVAAFTAAQIPDIDGRRYPASLAGDLYPEGIPIFEETEVPKLIKELHIDTCVFAYSDVSYQKVMSLSAIVNTAGANFMLLGPRDTMIKSRKPMVAVGAIRTGCGKSQTSRKVIEVLMAQGLKVVAVRHPMPYGDLARQKVQRFAAIEDLEKHKCTIEEMEEYEPHIVRGNVIYAGVDYGAILEAAENDPAGCDVIVWDGGNNDFPFYKPDLMITVMDPHRPGHESRYYPSEVTMRMADVLLINKMVSAPPEGIKAVYESIARINPEATVVEAASVVTVEDPAMIRNKRVLAVEDGPTLTHGEMKIGAATVAASRLGATLTDPRPYLVGKLKTTFETYPDIGVLLPAMGYGEQQIRDLEATINKTDCEAVLIGTPVNLNRFLKLNKPSTRVFYELQEIGKPTLTDILADFVKKI